MSSLPLVSFAARGRLRAGPTRRREHNVRKVTAGGPNFMGWTLSHAMTQGVGRALVARACRHASAMCVGLRREYHVCRLAPL